MANDTLPPAGQGSEFGFGFGTGAGQDVLYAKARSISARPIAPPNVFRLLPDYKVKRELRGIAIPWELTIRDLSGGQSRFAGPFDEIPNCVAWTDAVDLTHPGYILLAQKTTAATSPDPTGTFAGIHYQYIFGMLIWGLGSGTNVSLFKETSTTDPTPTGITYDPTSTDLVSCLGAVTLGGIATAKRLIVGLSSTSPAQIISDSNGTVAATMNALTADLRWIVETPLPTSTGVGYVILLQASTTIYSMSTESATSDAPVVIDTKVQRGTEMIDEGIFALEDGILGTVTRLWLMTPYATPSAIHTTYGSESLAHVGSRNLEGTDFQPLDFNEMPLGVLQAAHIVSPVHGSSIVATDGQRVVIHNGAIEENLNIFGEVLTAHFMGVGSENAALDYFRCRGFVVYGPDLYAWVQFIDVAGAVASQLALWKYNWLTKTWSNYSGWNSLATSGLADVVLTAGSHAVSPNTGFTQVYCPTLGSWLRIQLTRPGEVPYPAMTQWPGITSAFETPGTLVTPRWTFESPIRLGVSSLEGVPMVFESIEVRGDIDNSGSAGSVAVQLAQSTGFGTLAFSGMFGTASNFTFDDVTQFETDFRNRNYRRLPDNTDFAYEFQMKVTLTQGATTTKSPMVNAIVVRGISFCDGIVRSPRDVWGF